MTPTKLKELKEKLHDLLRNGFIRMNISSWDAPVLFLEKKDGYMFMNKIRVEKILIHLLEHIMTIMNFW